MGFKIFSIICDVEVVEGSTTRMALLTLSNIVFGIPFGLNTSFFCRRFILVYSAEISGTSGVLMESRASLRLSFRLDVLLVAILV